MKQIHLSYTGAALSLVTTYLASGTPIPLYGRYQLENGVSYMALSLSSVLYFIGAVTALLFFGRVSNFLGRKPIALVTVLLAGVSTFCFMNITGATPLIVGRLLQGLASGLASPAMAAWVVDNAKAVPRWLTPAILSCGPMTGLTIGGVGSGVLVEYGPDPRHLSFYIVLVLLLCCLALLMMSTDSVIHKSGALNSLKPRLALPCKARSAFPVAASTFVCTWALGGFFQAFGPAMAQHNLHSSSAVAAAFVFAAIMAPSSLGASLAGRVSAIKAQKVGMYSFTLLLGGILFFLYQGMLIPFVITSILAGIAQGGVLTGSIQTLVTDLEQDERASVLSLIYTTSYIGAAIPTLVAGRASEHYSLFTIACGYGVLALLGSIYMFVFHSKTSKTQVNQHVRS